MKQLFTFFYCALFFVAFSQTEQNLPVSMTEQEKTLMSAYLNESGNDALGYTTPPTETVRTMAEWEEVHGIVIGWASFPGMLGEIVQGAQEECVVYILTSNVNSVKTYLTNKGIDPNYNIVYMDTTFNSVWSRDYGPWSIYTDDVDELLTIDWVYNRPRPLDDKVPGMIAQLTETPLYEMTSGSNKLVSCGGNFMVDGFGTAFSSKLVMNENPSYTNAQMDTLLKKWMGIDRYIKMENLPYDGIHHIDMHMKLLNEETILIGEYPEGISDGPQIEANLLYVYSNYNSIFGTPYKIIRIPMPKDASNKYPSNNGQYWTYTNSTIVNNSVLVPIYDIPTDTVALNIYREAMPGYNIIGIDSRASIPSLGAIHCITKEFGAKNPLLISHQQLPDTEDNINPYEVVALIKHNSGIHNATLYYRLNDDETYLAVSMSPISGQAGYFSGLIPAQYNGTHVQYYIHAEAVSGKEQVRPMPAPEGYFHFNVFGNDEPDEPDNPDEGEDPDDTDDPDDTEDPEGNDDISAIAWNEMGSSHLVLDAVFPNPASAITCIPLISQKEQEITIGIYDVTGQLIVPVFDGNIGQGQQFKFFDASHMASGTYFIMIRSEEGIHTQKVVVK